MYKYQIAKKHKDGFSKQLLIYPPISGDITYELDTYEEAVDKITELKLLSIYTDYELLIYQIEYDL